MQDSAHIELTLLSARPQAMAALLRYFRDLDLAEEAFQEACLRALKSWPERGPPREPTAWLIMVGRNAALDSAKKSRNETPIYGTLDWAEEEDISLAERLDESDYRDDILRLLFVCGHPVLPATQQIALALRIVSGLTVDQIARAFLVSPAAMEQRITRAKRTIAKAGVAYETPGPADRAARFTSVSAMVYLIFNEGYSALSDRSSDRAQLAMEAIRLARLLVGLFPTESESLGLLALMLLQHSRTPARLDSDGQLILLENQDRSLWISSMIDEASVLLQKCIRRGQIGVYQLQAMIAAVHSRATSFDQTDWSEMERLYDALEHLTDSPVVALNRAAVVAKSRGPEQALLLMEPLAEKLSGYFYFHGARGALLKQVGRVEEARESLSRAIALATTAAEASYIRQQLDSLDAPNVDDINRAVG